MTLDCFGKQVHFEVQKHLNFGEVLLMVGQDQQLGQWSVDNALEMIWTANDFWIGQITIDESITMLEYKYVVVAQQSREIIEWEDGENRNLNFLIDEVTRISDEWNSRCINISLLSQIDTTLYLNILGCEAQQIQLSQTPYSSDVYKLNTKITSQTFLYQAKISLPLKKKGLVYKYSDEFNQWERGSSRLICFKKQSENTIMRNNVVYRRDSDLDFRLDYDQITHNIWVGSYLNCQQDIALLKERGINAVLNLQTDADIKKRGIDFENIAKQCEQHGILYVRYGIIDRDNQDFYKKGKQVLI